MPSSSPWPRSILMQEVCNSLVRSLSKRSFCKWSGKSSREKLLPSSIAWTQKWQEVHTHWCSGGEQNWHQVSSVPSTHRTSHCRTMWQVFSPQRLLTRHEPIPPLHNYFEILNDTCSSLALLASTCFLIASTSATTLQLCPLLMWDILYQRNCTVELLIRISPLSYALMRGAISPLILWLVQLKPVTENWTGLNCWGQRSLYI